MMTLDHYVTSFLKIIGYAKYVHNNKTIFFKISDKKLLKKYMKICEKTGSLTKKILILSLFMVIVINT